MEMRMTLGPPRGACSRNWRVDRAVTEWRIGSNVEEKQEAVKSAQSVEALQGTEDRCHPVCASADKVKPVLQQWNELYAKSTDDLGQF